MNYQQALAFLNSQRAIINPNVYRHKYPDITYQNFITVDTSAPEFADTVKTFTEKDIGHAMFISGNNDNIPTVDMLRASVDTMIRSAGVGYGYSYFEILAASGMGINLTDKRGVAAREASERFIDDLVFVGNASVGATGLFNDPSVSVASVVNGASASPLWEQKTGDEMVSDLDSLLLNSHTQMGAGSMADTLCLPYSLAFLANRTRIGDTQITVLQHYRENNAYTMFTGQPLTIRADRRLETAGAGGTRRIVAYTNDESVVSLQMPMPFRLLDPYQDGALHFKVPGIMRVGTVDFHKPAMAQYGDGA